MACPHVGPISHHLRLQSKINWIPPGKRSVHGGAHIFAAERQTKKSNQYDQYPQARLFHDHGEVTEASKGYQGWITLGQIRVKDQAWV